MAWDGNKHCLMYSLIYIFKPIIITSLKIFIFCVSTILLLEINAKCICMERLWANFIVLWIFICFPKFIWWTDIKFALLKNEGREVEVFTSGLKPRKLSFFFLFLNLIMTCTGICSKFCCKRTMTACTWQAFLLSGLLVNHLMNKPLALQTE